MVVWEAAHPSVVALLRGSGQLMDGAFLDTALLLRLLLN